MTFRRSSPRPAETPAASLHEAALRLLARRAYSRRELAERLEARGYPPPAVRTELDTLETAGLVDDTALAESVVRSQLRRGRGRRSVTTELRRRGLRRQERETALEALDPDDEASALALAVNAAVARHPSWRRLLQARRKVIRYLLARGFDPGQVRSALAERASADNGEHDAAEPDDLHDP